MPYGAGIFLPSETAYKDPGRFRDVLEAEGTKQAKYLADMDQFFAQLEEMKRQFDITAEMKERFFEEEMAFREEELEWRGEESALDRALRRWEVGETVGVRREEIRAGERGRERMAGLEERRLELTTGLERRRMGLEEETFALARGESEFLRDLYGAQERRTEETHRAATNILGAGPVSEYGEFYEPGVPIEQQYIPSWA